MEMIKVGDVVKCKINMQPLKKGDSGTVKEINHGQPFPLLVEFPGIQTALPMKMNEESKQ